MRQRALISAIVLVILATVASSCLFTLSQTRYALVFGLGQVRRVLSDPGLHFKWPAPFETVVYLDRRMLTIESTDPERVQTSEKKNLLIDSYVKWQISDPRMFYVTFGGDEDSARERLQAQIRDALNAAVNVRTVKQVVSTERNKVMQQILDSVDKRAEPLGVKVVDVRLKRIEFAPEISQSVYRRMEAERTRVANQLRSQGAAESEKIRADADRQREEILAEAYAKAQAVKGQGDAQAGEISAKAYGRDPAFYAFYKSLQAYRTAFNDPSDMLVVNADSPFFQFMKPPTDASVPPPPGSSGK